MAPLAKILFERYSRLFQAPQADDDIGFVFSDVGGPRCLSTGSGPLRSTGRSERQALGSAWHNFIIASRPRSKPCFERLKDVCDPDGRLNPGKLLPTGKGCLEVQPVVSAGARLDW